VHPITGRIHGDFIPCGQKSGRISCTSPNLLGLPADARRAVIAPAGRMLVVADLSQIELRIAAALSGDPAMREVFRSGRDLHRLTAAAIAGVAEADVTKEQRQAAKAVNFGSLFGQGARGLSASAWAGYSVDMSITEAERAIVAFRARYPVLIEWQRQMVVQADAAGVLRSVLGRPLRAEWEPWAQIRYTLALNYPVQASAADLLLVALAKVDRALTSRIDAEITLSVHDEIVIEAAEDDAEDARDRLVGAMLEAWAEVFPGAPDTGIVACKIVRAWGDAK
jgi:DNA polymerase-1